MNSDKIINLYGAVTKIPCGNRAFSFNQSVRRTADRLLFQFKNFHKINHGNYANEGTYNLGDHAIAIAINQQMNASIQDAKINLVDWGDLDFPDPRASILFSGSGYFSSSHQNAHQIEFAVTTYWFSIIGSHVHTSARV